MINETKLMPGHVANFTVIGGNSVVDIFILAGFLLTKFLAVKKCKAGWHLAEQGRKTL